MLYNVAKKLTILFILMMIQSVLNAQMVGNPVGTQGAGEWSVSCSGSFMNQEVGNEIAHSQRWLFKNVYGITPWMDLVGMIGIADLKLDSPKKSIEKDYEDKRDFAFGLGLTFTLKKEAENQPVGIFAGAHFLRFPSKGVFTETVEGEYLFRDFHMEYDWREYCVFGGLSYRISNIRVYGCGIGWGISRLEKRAQYSYESKDEIQENKIYDGEEKGEFQSPLWTGALVGVEMVFPNPKYVISFEGLFYNTQNFILMVGIGQTGIFEPGW